MGLIILVFVYLWPIPWPQFVEEDAGWYDPRVKLQRESDFVDLVVDEKRYEPSECIRIGGHVRTSTGQNTNKRTFTTCTEDRWSIRLRACVVSCQYQWITSTEREWNRYTVEQLFMGEE